MRSHLFLVIALAACKPTPTPPAESPGVEDSVQESPAPTAYEQLGGPAGMHALVQAFLAQVVADARINWMFGNADLGALAPLLESQFCALTGGGCVYAGRPMDETHAAMAITDAQFDAMAEDLLLGLSAAGIPYSATFSGEYPADTLVNAVFALRGEIVRDPDADAVLFNRLGGLSVVQAVVDAFVARVAADPRISPFFATTDLFRLNRLLVEQICVATGGYCLYTGRDMAAAHAGLGICPEDFDALIEDFLAALGDVGVPFTPGTYDQGVGADELLVGLAGMRADIEGCAR